MGNLHPKAAIIQVALIHQFIGRPNRSPVEPPLLGAIGHLIPGQMCGKVAYHLGDVGQDYDKALEVDPRFADAYSNRGNAYKASGHLALAIQDYNRSLELDPNIAETYYNRGNVYMDIGDLALAIQDYSKVLELNQGPTATYAYYNRAISWLRLSEWERAKPDLVAAKSMGIQLAKALPSIGYEGINDFEHKNGIELPGEIVELLTG